MHSYVNLYTYYIYLFILKKLIFSSTQGKLGTSILQCQILGRKMRIFFEQLFVYYIWSTLKHTLNN